MADESHLDNRYFVSAHVYNCPFCNRRHVAYTVCDHISFDWTDKKKCYCYYVLCHSCGHVSMHLSFTDIGLTHIGQYSGRNRWRFVFDKDTDVGKALDRLFFYSVPTSFFVLDERIPRVLRELLTEAEGCLKSNYLTGASACARKIVYELAHLNNAAGDNYEDRIKALKQIHPEV